MHFRVSDPRRKATSLGMTESLGPHSIESLHVELPAGKEDSFGRSVPGIEHRIVDPGTGDELPAGQAGEIWIRGYSLMLGLLGQDPADVFEPGGWYRNRRPRPPRPGRPSVLPGPAGHRDQGGGHQCGAP